MDNNIAEILNNARRSLKENNIDSVRDADFLLEKVLGHKLTNLNKTIGIEELEEFKRLLKRRISRESMDSILGNTEFLGLNIPFNKDTLTPRQETEIMVDSIIRENKDKSSLKVLDLCSGSGCIGIAIKKHIPSSSVTLADVSDKAISISQSNARLNNIDVEIIKSDLFENIHDLFDIIVSNPPYIPSNDIKILEEEVLKYDPLIALDGGFDGLDLYRRISSEISGYLNPNGLIYIEFGVGQSEDIKRLFERDFKDIEIIKDYSGIDRYIKARKKSLC